MVTGGSLKNGRTATRAVVPEVLNMNHYKLESVLSVIRRQGALPTDERGVILSPDDILAWHGLDRLLTAEEQRDVKRELLAMIEAQTFTERVRMERP